MTRFVSSCSPLVLTASATARPYWDSVCSERAHLSPGIRGFRQLRCPPSKRRSASHNNKVIRARLRSHLIGVLIALAVGSANICFPSPIEPDPCQLGLFERRSGDCALSGDEGHGRLLPRLERIERHGGDALPSRYPPGGNERHRRQQAQGDRRR